MLQRLVLLASLLTQPAPLRPSPPSPPSPVTRDPLPSPPIMSFLLNVVTAEGRQLPVHVDGSDTVRSCQVKCTCTCVAMCWDVPHAPWSIHLLLPRHPRRTRTRTRTRTMECSTSNSITHQLPAVVVPYHVIPRANTTHGTPPATCTCQHTVK